MALRNAGPTIKRSISLAVGAAAVAAPVAAPIVFSEPAQGTADIQAFRLTCPNDDSCARSGQVAHQFIGNQSWWGGYAQSACGTGTWDNCASALSIPGSSSVAFLHEDKNYGGSCTLALNAGQQYNNLGAFSCGGSSWDNRISSSK